MGVAFGSGKFYFNCILIVGACVAIDIFTSAYYIMFGDNLAGTLMILRKERGTLDNNVDMPEKVERLLKICASYDQKDEPDNNVNINIVKNTNVKDLDKIDRVQIELPLSDKINIK